MNKRNFCLILYLLIPLLFIIPPVFSITLTSVSVSPNPADVTDFITLTSIGQDTNYAEAAYGVLGGEEAGHSGYICQSFVANISGDINSITIIGDDSDLNKLKVFEFANSNTTGKFLTAQDTVSQRVGIKNIFYDLNVAISITKDSEYWVCSNFYDANPLVYTGD